MKKILLSLLFLVSVTAFAIQSADEIRKVDGKEYKVYKVQKGDTWYGIARKYEISYAELRVANKGVDDKLVTGEELLIPAKLDPNDPYFQKNKVEAPVKTAPSAESSKDKFHVVQVSQTLYSISKQYGISVDQLKSWNNLKTNEISVGQKLMVGKSLAHTDAAKVKGVPATTTEQTNAPDENKEAATPVTKDDSDSENKQAETKTAVEQPKVAEQNHDEKIDTSKITSQVEDMPPPAEDTKIKEEPVINPKTSEKNSDEIVFENGRQQVNETGSALVITDEDSNTEKYYALHKTAKTGTIIRVMNLTNSRKAYVKVIGQFPDDSDNSGVLIKISKATAEKLEITEKTARVNLLYGIGGE
jgi:LysM repeat protein